MLDANKIEVISRQKRVHFCTQVIGGLVLCLHNRINKKASVIYLLELCMLYLLYLFEIYHNGPAPFTTYEVMF
jgi:hypothetical protein